VTAQLALPAFKIAAVAIAVQIWGCTQPSLGCREDLKAECGSTFAPCTVLIDPCRDIPPGATNSLVEIDSSPTPAEIFVDGTYVGRTPLKRYLWFSSTTRSVTVVAEPLYPGQARQEQSLNVHPLPRRLTFFMNNPAKTVTTDEAAH
jgi:hypothetical protein